jgi:hypothetical protein
MIKQPTSNDTLEGYTDTNKRFASYEIRKKDTERALVKVLDWNREIYLHYNINDNNTEILKSK